MPFAHELLFNLQKELPNMFSVGCKLEDYRKRPIIQQMRQFTQVTYIRL